MFRIGKFEIRIAPLLALPLLFITKGHMSGSVSYLTLEQIALSSDAIFLVRKIEPHVVHREEPVGGIPIQYFTFTSYRYVVKSVIHSKLEKDAPDTLEVQSASDDANFRNEMRHLDGQSTRRLLYESYRPQTQKLDAQPEILIFVRYNETKGRFSFVARNALEGPALIPQVRAILSNSPERPLR